MKDFDWRSALRYESGSVLMIVFGVLLAVKPDLASAAVSAVLGWALVAVGVALMMAGILGGVKPGYLVSGVLLVVVGNWFHRHPLMIASVIGMVLGVLVLSQGWQAAQDAQRTKKLGGFWHMGAVLAVAELLIGLRLIFSPLSISRLVLSIVGLGMVVCGACNLVAHHRSVKYIREDNNIIDADE